MKTKLPPSEDIAIKIIAIMPCYRANLRQARYLLMELLDNVDHVIMVDDCCPNHSGHYVIRTIHSERLHVLWTKQNLGVGGAMKAGYKYALDNFKKSIIIKIDCDGQMLPKDIAHLIKPILLNQADVAKANRYYDFEEILKIPKVRLIGNLILSFLAKASTGYWELFDPNNGFIAISAASLRYLPLKKISNDYFFETDLLFRSGLEDLIVKEVRIAPIYAGEKSSLKPFHEISNFLCKNLINTAKRCFYQYFLYDFNPGSLELLISIACFIFCISWTIFLLLSGYWSGKISSPGDVSLFIISALIAIQFLLAFLHYDSSQRVFMRKISSTPKHSMLNDSYFVDK